MALLFHDHGTRRGWVVSSTPRPYFTAGKDPVPIVQEAGWAPGQAWTGGKSHPTGIRSPDRPARNLVTISTELPVDSIAENFFFFKFFSSNFAEIHPTGLRSPDRPARSSVTIPTELPVDSIAEKIFLFFGKIFQFELCGDSPHRASIPGPSSP